MTHSDKMIELTQNLSPVKNRALGKPILIEPHSQPRPQPPAPPPLPSSKPQVQGMPADIYNEGPRRVSLNTGFVVFTSARDPLLTISQYTPDPT